MGERTPPERERQPPITEHLPEDHEGREACGLRTDPTPDKGRALARLEEKQGRTVAKGHRASDGPASLPLGGD